jgi:hypothetical protein
MFFLSCSANLFCMTRSPCPVLRIPFCLSSSFCPACLSCQPVLSTCPVLQITYFLSSFACPAHVLSSCLVLHIPFFLSCFGFSLQLVPFCRAHSTFPVLLSCFSCPALSVLFCLFRSVRPVLSVLFCLSCSACLVLPVLFCLASSACPVLAFLSWCIYIYIFPGGIPSRLRFCALFLAYNFLLLPLRFCALGFRALIFPPCFSLLYFRTPSFLSLSPKDNTLNDNRVEHVLPGRMPSCLRFCALFETKISRFCLRAFALLVFVVLFPALFFALELLCSQFSFVVS